MNFNKLIEVAKVRGIEELEIYFSRSGSTTVKLFNSEIESYTASNQSSITVKGIYEGKLGTVTTEKLTDDSIEYVVSTIINNANIAEKLADVSFFEGSQSYEEVKTTYPQIKKYDDAYKIQLLKDIDALVRRYPHIDSVSHAICSEGESEVILKNTHGLDLSYESNMFMLFINVVAKKDDQIKTYGDSAVIRDFDSFDKEAFAKQVAEGASRQLGGSTPTSGNYKAILTNKMASSIIEAMIGNFSGETVRKGISKFGDKLETVVAAPCVTIVDNPLMEEGIATRSFDDDGVATSNKDIIKDGVLKTFLYDRKTAALTNNKSTGNGFRSVIRHTNFIIQPGTKSFDELVQSVGNGVLITSLAGLHSGLSAISGDFSLQSSGYLIEDGKVGSPIDLFTISGNFFELLKDVVEVGSDLRQETNGVGSGSLVLSTLSISGK